MNKETSVNQGDSRATFGTRLGALAAAVGSAVGFGNIWRFPYMTGQNGGAAFLLIYVISVLLLGVPLLIAEFCIGRSAHRNVVGAFRKVAPGTRWYLVGVLGLVVACLILGFYVVLSGWTLHATCQAVMGGLSDYDFHGFVTDPVAPLVWTVVAILINVGILLGGVQKGIERASNIMMPILAVLLIILVGNSMLLPEFRKGMEFLFVPDWSKVTGRTWIDAMGQAFFSLSVAMGIIVAYGSYLSDNTKIGKTAIQVASLDTLIAVLAGIVIFPACFSFGVAPGEGSGLVFVTLPQVFSSMPFGWLMGSLFFILVTLAGLTSCMSIFEVPISYLQEEWHMSRRNAVLASAAWSLVLGIGCSLSMGLWSGVTIGGDILFDFLDHLTARYMMPVCAFMTSLFVGWWLEKEIIRNAITNWRNDSGWYLRPLILLLRTVVPLCILLIFLSGIGLI